MKRVICAVMMTVCSGLAFSQPANKVSKQLCEKGQGLYYFYRTMEDVCGFNEREVSRGLFERTYVGKCSRQLSEKEMIASEAKAVKEIGDYIDKMGKSKFCSLATEIYRDMLNGPHFSD